MQHDRLFSIHPNESETLTETPSSANAVSSPPNPAPSAQTVHSPMRTYCFISKKPSYNQSTKRHHRRKLTTASTKPHPNDYAHSHA
jgi:hypothetical protein